MILDCNKLTDYLLTEIRYHVDVAVIGLSGGADSSLVATLCAQALGKENVFGISMPHNDNDKDRVSLFSGLLAEQLGINHFIRHINQISDAINEQIYITDTTELTDTNKGNSRSRARMCVLYGVAHNLSVKLAPKRARVMGTGNLSEDFIGYDTKGGDALADIFPIGELFKSEVYQLLEHFRDEGIITENIIDRVPSAGLVEGQTDEGDLGYSYNEMEKSVRICLNNYDSMADEGDETTKFVWNRHKTHKHKHEAPLVVKIRDSFCD